MIPPCKDCPDKGCGAKHAECSNYLAFKAECESARATRLLEQKGAIYAHKKIYKKRYL